MGRAKDISTSHVFVHDQPLPIVWEDFLTERPTYLFIYYDTNGDFHEVSIGWIGIASAPPLSFSVPGYATQTIHFSILEVDRIPVPSPVGFTVIMRPTSSSLRLVRLIPDSTSEIIEFHDSIEGFSLVDESDASALDDISDNSFDIVNELESLGLLEAQAEELRLQIAAKKDAISDKLKIYREQKCLKHLIQECDGIICAAKVITQRICDKMGINTKSDFRYTQMPTSDLHSFRVNKHGDNGDFWEHTKNTMHGNAPKDIPLMLPNGGSQQTLQAVEIVGPPNPFTPVIRVLEVLAGIFGLTALWILLKRKCVSARTRAERAADREERRNARAYKKAARRAEMRKRWDHFVSAVNCFKYAEGPRIEDYEEKRALILQDALLEQDLDMAEKGEVMEAEIRELRYAHEIISSLVRVDENRYDLVTPIHDPPPPLVPLPYTPVTRSRASSNTLPSYTSETLPDYSSRRPSTYTRRSSSSSTVGFTPSTTTDQEGRTTPQPLRSENSGSSVIDMSPRPSAETLRTRPSGETTYR